MIQPKSENSWIQLPLHTKIQINFWRFISWKLNFLIKSIRIENNYSNYLKRFEFKNCVDIPKFSTLTFTFCTITTTNKNICSDTQKVKSLLPNSGKTLHKRREKKNPLKSSTHCPVRSHLKRNLTDTWRVVVSGVVQTERETFVGREKKVSLQERRQRAIKQ